MLARRFGQGGSERKYGLAKAGHSTVTGLEREEVADVLVDGVELA